MLPIWDMCIRGCIRIVLGRLADRGIFWRVCTRQLRPHMIGELVRPSERLKGISPWSPSRWGGQDRTPQRPNRPGLTRCPNPGAAHTPRLLGRRTGRRFGPQLRHARRVSYQATEALDRPDGSGGGGAIQHLQPPGVRIQNPPPDRLRRIHVR